MIDEHAGELAADRLRHERGGDGGIHTARQRQQRPTRADRLADGADRRLTVVCHRPVAGRAADRVQEVAQHFCALLGVVDLRVELHAVEAARLVADADGRAGVGMRAQRKARGHSCHIVAVAHPGDALLAQPGKKTAARVKDRAGLAVFARGVVLRGGHLAAERMRQKLAAIADAQHRHAERKEVGIDLRRACGVHALRSAGENDADGRKLAHLLRRDRKGLYLAVNVLLTHAPRDELGILRAKVQDQNFLHLMRPPGSKCRSRPRGR